MEISLHCQAIPGWAPAWAQRKGVTWVKVIDPPKSNPFPGARVIGRTFMSDGESNEMVLQGKAGAHRWFLRWQPVYERCSYIHAFEGPNEPPVATKDQRDQLAAFTAELNNLMHARGWRTVAYNLSVGWPDVGHAADLKPGIANADYLGLHEYSAPTMQDGAGWYCLRYRRTCDELGLSPSRVLITEAGIDGGVISQPQQGWRSYATQEQYLEQLDWYGQELARDGVPAAFVFTAGGYPPWNGPGGFEIDQELASKMTVHYPSAVQPQPLPQPPTPSAEIRPLSYPFLKAWPVSSSYADHLNRKPPSTAPGIDLAVPEGRPIRAPIAGKVTNCYWRKAGGRSLWIVGDKYKVYLAHMSVVARLSGERVEVGDTVGQVGSTGNSTGPHLHLSVQRAGRYVDPEPLLARANG
jgi:murein DD-endopeptidase MepM/ murein hydrolase activator NlpD